MKYTKQSGDAMAVLVICLSLALVATLGWIFWQNFVHKEPVVKDTEIIAVGKDDKTQSALKTQDPVYKYVDLRKSGDGSGLVVKTKADVDKLPAIDPTLKAYFIDHVGEQTQGMGGSMYALEFTIDRVYGSYAAGLVPGAYGIYGPKDGSGEVSVVAGTQNEGMECNDLSANKVPKELVDNKCFNNGKIVVYDK